MGSIGRWGVLSGLILLGGVRGAAPEEGGGDPLVLESDLPIEKIVLSGEFRQRFENQINYDFDDRSSGDDDFVGSRIRLNADVRIDESLSMFLQVQDSRNWGGNPSTASNTTIARLGDSLDLHQGYARIRWGDGWSLQAGRQDWSYGTQKVISPLGWSNVGRAFDGIRLRRESDPVTADLLASKIGESPASDENDVELHGLYTTWRAIEGHPFDLYVLWSRDQRRTSGEIAARGPRNTDIITYGLQYTRKGIPAGPGDLDWGTELNLQQGDRGSDDLDASAVHARIGYTLRDVLGTPRVGYHYDEASGDGDPNDGDEGTFDQLHPLGHGFHGFMDFVGRRNIEAHRFQLGVQPRDDLEVALDWHLFDLETSRDHLYGAGGGVQRNTVAGGTVSDDVGEEIDLTVTYTASPYWKLQAGYSHFFTGAYFIDTATATSANDDADFIYMQSAVRF